MNMIIVVVAVAVGGWVLLILGLKGMAAILRKSAVRAVQAALHGEAVLKITDNASFLGADFPGPNLPPRTSGVLAVTGSRVLFLPWYPRRAITLPAATIVGVSLEDFFRDMAYNIPVLSVKVKGVGDPHGNMGWLVHDAGEWEQAIGGILKR